MELSAPIAALATKRAITSPLMNRKAALGLSRSRRPAMSVAGRLARFAMSREPAVVNHGPARTSPTTRSTKPTSSSRSWPPTAPGLPAASKYASTAMPASSGMIRTIRGGRDDARRFTPSGDIWTLRSARRADTTAATGTPITASTMSIQCSERSPCGEGRPGERHVVEQRSEGEEECEADCDARDRRDHCLHRGDHGNLTWRGADEPHRGEALLAPRGRQPARGRDQDQHRQQERDGSAGQDELQNGSAPDGVLAGVAAGRRALDGSDLDRTRCLRELARGVADDDDQRVRGRQCRCADGPDLVPRIPVTKLVRRFGLQGAPYSAGEAYVLTRSRQVRNPRRDRSVRPGGGHVDPVDRLVAELVGARQPPQPAGCRGRS